MNHCVIQNLDPAVSYIHCHWHFYIGRQNIQTTFLEPSNIEIIFKCLNNNMYLFIYFLSNMNMSSQF